MGYILPDCCFEDKLCFRPLALSIIRPAKQACHGDILINSFPVDAHSLSDQFPVIALLICCVE